MADTQEISVDADKVVVGTIDAACVASFYATNPSERCDFGTTFLHLAHAVGRLGALGEAETLDDVRALLGEALLWAFGCYYIHGRDPVTLKASPCKWLKSHEWSTRGPDATHEDLGSAMQEVRTKLVKITGLAALYCGTPNKNQPALARNSLLPVLGELVNDRHTEAADLRTMCAFYKLSPRACLEEAILRRKRKLERTHKEFTK